MDHAHSNGCAFRQIRPPHQNDVSIVSHCSSSLCSESFAPSRPPTPIAQDGAHFTAVWGCACRFLKHVLDMKLNYTSERVFTYLITYFLTQCIRLFDRYLVCRPQNITANG
jgi:hypothetical protein